MGSGTRYERGAVNTCLMALVVAGQTGSPQPILYMVPGQIEKKPNCIIFRFVVKLLQLINGITDVEGGKALKVDAKRITKLLLPITRTKKGFEKPDKALTRYVIKQTGMCK